MPVCWQCTPPKTFALEQAHIDHTRAKHSTAPALICRQCTPPKHFLLEQAYNDHVKDKVHPSRVLRDGHMSSRGSTAQVLPSQIRRQTSLPTPARQPPPRNQSLPQNFGEEPPFGCANCSQRFWTSASLGMHSAAKHQPKSASAATSNSRPRTNTPLHRSCLDALPPLTVQEHLASRGILSHVSSLASSPTTSVNSASSEEIWDYTSRSPFSSRSTSPPTPVTERLVLSGTKVHKAVVDFIVEQINARSPNTVDAVAIANLRESVERMQGLDIVPSLVRSFAFRRELIQFSRSLDVHSHPSMREAADRDRADIIQLVRRLVNSAASETTILGLNVEDKDQLMEVLSTVCKDTTVRGDSYIFGKVRKLKQKLYKSCLSIPASMFITGTQLIDDEDCKHGGFADIYRATYRGRMVAVKCLRLSQATKNDPNVRTALLEAMVWDDLEHQNILEYIGLDDAIFPNHPPCIVTLWMQNGTVMEHIRDNMQPDSSIDSLILEIAHGLAYLHSRGVVHGDLRSPNILVDDMWNIRLADFGLAKFTDTTLATETSNHNGSVRWMAPELHLPEECELERYQRTTQSDIYAFACVCLELYTLKRPFSDVERDGGVIMRVMRGERPRRPRAGEGRSMSDDLWTIVERCWVQKYLERPSVPGVLDMMKSTDFGLGH